MTTPPASSLDAPTLRRLLDEDPAIRILDVRTAGEFATAHIRGAYNVPLDQLGEHRDELASLDHPVVVVCQSGARATKAMEQLQASGGVDLRLLVGGMNAWTAAGGDVTVLEERWSLERQVRLVAGLLVLTSVMASIVVSPVRFVAAFVGAGLTFAALTNSCLMGTLLAKLPYNQGPSCDVDEVVRQLSASTDAGPHTASTTTSVTAGGPR